MRHVSPQQKLLFAIAALFLALLTHPIPQFFIAAWLSVWTVCYARIPAKVYLQVLSVAGLFLLISLPALVFNFVLASENASVQADALGGFLIHNQYLYVSQSGLTQALQLGMRSLSCTSCLLFVLFTIPFNDLLQTLRQWRVPTLLTELLLLMYRFVFLFLDVLTELQLAQRARSGYRTRQRWMYSVNLLIGQLLVRSLQHYHQFSLALASRGFNGTFQTYSSSSYRYSKRYAIESLIGCLTLLLLNLKLHPPA